MSDVDAARSVRPARRRAAPPLRGRIPVRMPIPTSCSTPCGRSCSGPGRGGGRRSRARWVASRPSWWCCSSCSAAEAAAPDRSRTPPASRGPVSDRAAPRPRRPHRPAARRHPTPCPPIDDPTRRRRRCRKRPRRRFPRPVPTRRRPATSISDYSSAGGSSPLTSPATRCRSRRAPGRAGYTAEVHEDGPTRVEVRFDNGQTEWRIRVDVENGQLTPEITQHGRPTKPRGRSRRVPPDRSPRRNPWTPTPRPRRPRPRRPSRVAACARRRRRRGHGPGAVRRGHRRDRAATRARRPCPAASRAAEDRGTETEIEHGVVVEKPHGGAATPSVPEATDADHAHDVPRRPRRRRHTDAHHAEQEHPVPEPGDDNGVDVPGDNQGDATTASDGDDVGPAVPSGTQSFSSVGGSIVVSVNGSSISLASSSPAAGFAAEVHDNGPSRVEVRFTERPDRVAHPGRARQRRRRRRRSPSTGDRANAPAQPSVRGASSADGSSR